MYFPSCIFWFLSNNSFEDQKRNIWKAVFVQTTLLELRCHILHIQASNLTRLRKFDNFIEVLNQQKMLGLRPCTGNRYGVYISKRSYKELQTAIQAPWKPGPAGFQKKCQVPFLRSASLIDANKDKLPYFYILERLSTEQLEPSLRERNHKC